MRFPAVLIATSVACAIFVSSAAALTDVTQRPTGASISTFTDKPRLVTHARPSKVKMPRPATRTRPAVNVPERPMDGGSGRRIVYDKSLMTVWVMNNRDEVVYRFPIVGRWDRPRAGEYRIYSQSEKSGNPYSRVTFDHMTRFTYGNDGKTPIGFHSIPIYYDGRMMHGIDQLGLPVATGGCIRMHANDAEALYRWAKIGDRVVVLTGP